MWRFTDQYESELNARPDGRDENQFRDILINWSSIGTANGSAIVKLGNTTVVSGITFEKNIIELNNNQNIDELKNNLLLDLNNLIDINVKYQPHSSFCFKIESNDQESKESLIITTHFKNILNNSTIFDLNQLIKYNDNKLIINKMIIEILIENYDGNGFDASNLALLASIIDCKLDDKKFEILNYPISTTFSFKLNDNKDQIYQDPNLDDEKLCDGQFNITINADTNELVFLNKKGDQGLNFDTLNKCINIANKRASSIKNLLKLKQTKF